MVSLWRWALRRPLGRSLRRPDGVISMVRMVQVVIFRHVWGVGVT
jgi:hypothetical protein